jgi:hypothetical protein
VKYLSYIGLALGDVRLHKAGLNPARRAFSFLRTRMLAWRCWHGAKIQLKVRLRPHLYRLRNWIVRRVGT